jgi:hypothetical protein
MVELRGNKGRTRVVSLTLLPEWEEAMDVKLSLGLFRHHNVKIYKGFDMEE